MTAAETFVAELDAKNQTSIERLVGALAASVAKEGFEVADVLRLTLKAAIEGAEVAALWVTDCDDLGAKLVLAEQCGDGAKHYRLIAGRLAALGFDLSTYDPRDGGYSKLFAFLRSLQTDEERSSAGHLTLKAMAMARFTALANFCEEKGDVDTANLYRGQIMTDELRYYDEGKRALALSATNEESQARARRAAYRALELVGEAQDPLQLRRAMLKRR
ncbi:MAG TPA: ferritin-like domain-containing protein [Polyangia bacterium]|nr:ferritin-like domain-containing protein [Polyangia bacterium]